MTSFVNPTLPVLFRRDTISRWSLVSGVYAWRSEKSHRGGNMTGKLPWTPSPKEGHLGLLGA